MSDNLRRYRAIRRALSQGYPATPKGNVARHLTTLAALISGIVGSQSTQLPKIATQVPDGTKPESRVKRFARWMDNDTIAEEVYFVPYAEVLLRHLALQTLVLILDGGVGGSAGRWRVRWHHAPAHLAGLSLTLLANSDKRHVGTQSSTLEVQ